MTAEGIPTEHETASDAIVVGGSLAGLMTALSLARAGAHVTVVERSTAKRRSGAALAVDGRELERALGADAAAAVLRTVDPDGYRSAVTPATWEAVHAGLTTAVGINPLISIQYDTRIVKVGQDNDEAWVIDEQNTQHRASLLIGADGHRSVVRRHVDSEHPDAAFAGYVLWLGIANERDVRVPIWPTSLDIVSSGDDLLLGYPLPGQDGFSHPGSRRLGWAWYDATQNDVFRAVGSVVGNVVHHSLFGSDIPEPVRMQLRHRAEQAWETPWSDAIRACLDRADVTATPIAEYLPERLVRDRVGLVGDAAHVPTPMTGRGFAEALRDATELGRATQQHADPRAALMEYERRRLQPARDLVMSGQSFSGRFGRP